MEELTTEQKNLLNAIELGDVSLVKEMVKGGVSPNFGLGDNIESNPIVFCSLTGQFDIAVWLINAGGATVNDNVIRFIDNVIGDLSLSLFIHNKLRESEG